MVAIFLILVLVAATAFIFTFLIKRNNRHLENGVFLENYQQLISLLTDNRKAEIIKVKTTSVSLKITLNKDFHFFTLSEVDERLIIVWKLQSRAFGKRGKEWSFNTAYSQLKMYQEVLTDIRNYQEYLRNEKPFLDESSLSAV